MEGDNHFNDLVGWFRKNTEKNVLIALSGGVDSAVVALAAKKALQDKAIAITANYKTLAEEELKTSQNVAKEINIEHIIIEYDELQDIDFIKNDLNRCYYCRNKLSEYLLDFGKKNNVTDIVDGTNIEDLYDYRPGIKALDKNGIKHPLVEMRFNKKIIRDIAKRHNLSVYDKPSNSCLASRIPTGTTITKEKLERIESIEKLIKKLFNINQVRVRDHEEIARIETDVSEMKKLFDIEKLSKLNNEVRKFGFKYVTVDIGGYKQGSLIVLNEKKDEYNKC
ncbi:MAG: ATP-dependent sacrificial sulfur transferase LarE [Nitrososphaeraceae archaeon]|nr:ATP-dependent sacrificial sulfur transferase LarE [Nitrososphaeraceae archaeon]